jgi:hypothetical protein
LKLKIGTIRGRLGDGVRQTIFGSYWLDLVSETDLRIEIKDLVFDDAYFSKVIDDKKSWFTRMEVVDLTYHQFFFTANSLGQQPTTSRFLQPLTSLRLALVATAIHCAQSEYATGKKVTVMFSHDEYQGKFCLSTVTDCISAEVIALIEFKLPMVGLLHCTPPPPVVLACYKRLSSIPVGTPQSPWPSSVWIDAVIFHSAL